jgi:D-3-phosphoglycerate dehydrogenase
MPTLDKAELEEIRSYLDLGRRMGMLHSQMDKGTVKSATLRYRGEIASKNTRLITASFAAGWMESALDQQVNLVNAEVLLKDRGIQIIEEKTTDPGDFGSMIQTEVTTDRKTYVASATLFGKQFLRLVQLGPYRLDAHLDGTLFVFTHRDVPGLIGYLGTAFGRHNINIAQMNVGREHPGGEAIGVVNLDTYPPDEVLKEVQAHKDIVSISVIRLPAVGETPPWLGS